MKISLDFFEAFLKCPTKCWLRFTSEPTAGNAYAEWVQTQSESYRADAARRLMADVPANECDVAPLVENLKTGKWRVAVDVPARIELGSSRGKEAQISPPENGQSLLTSATAIETYLHAVERLPSAVRGQPAQFIPIHFIYRNKLTKDDKLLLAFDAFVVSEMLGRNVCFAKIIHGDDHSTLKVKTPAQAGEVRKRLGKITALLTSPTPPDLVLNRHCAECEFQARCRRLAVEKDDLSLLAGMSAKERQKLRSKGIFTVTQLSYTFRPRRRPKRQRDKREKYHHSLKALAIREQKIHIVGNPELKIEGTPVYLDVEGLPDRDFYYLIGLRIGNGDSAVQHSLWADTVADEGKIWREFLAILEAVEKPVLIHYGSYETIFLKEMKERHSKPSDEPVMTKAIGSPINLVSVIFAKIYFPTFSNSLKDIAGWLGYRWSSTNATGSRAVIWRTQWEESRGTQGKTELIGYNAQDCEALKRMTATIHAIDLPNTCQEAKDNQQPVVVAADSLLDQSTLFRRFASPIAELEAINKAARWDYQRERIYIRGSKKIRGTRNRKVRKVIPQPNKVVVIVNPPICPQCHRSTKLRSAPASTLYDVRFGRFGMKRWIVRYEYCRGWCPSCHGYFGRPKEFWGQSKYGRNLVSLVVFEVVGLCMPQQTVTEGLNRLLGFQIRECSLNNLKASAARHYRSTWKSILAQMLAGHLIQADETRISVKGKNSYVWVLTSLDSVIYLHTETREGDRIQELLRGFNGVLVSDFYAVYDSISCPQQKCLIHLLRDLNDELLNHPYDEELKQIITSFAHLLKPMVETVDRHGLKRHYLRKHHLHVKRFYRQLGKNQCKGEPATKCKHRFEKNRDKLFTFLDYDGVPWNNNNAEHAIKAFARLRRVIEGLSTPKGIEEYLILLSVCQTCKYTGVDFLDFLRSGEQDIHAFAESRRRRRHGRANPDVVKSTAASVSASGRAGS